MNFLKALTVAGLMSLLAACGSTQVKLDVTATDNLNLNQFEEPLPLVLRIYQLSDVQAFKNATFDELWKSDKSVLANSLLTVEERTVNPSQKMVIDFEQAENANYVAIMALFRNRADDNWRVYQDLNSGPVQLSTSMEVLLTSNAISIPGQE